MKNGGLHIDISGTNTNIANISQGDKNTLKASIESHISKCEQELEHALVSLRQAIESDTTLSQAQRQAAVSDLSSFTEEVKKPISEQDPGTKKLFWERLTEILKFSSALISLSVVVAKLTGFA